MKSSVSIILLNYNGKQFNKECIDSILLQKYKDFEIIFVDNFSVDGSLEEVEKIYEKEIRLKKIIIVKSSINLGFTGGNNLGVKYANPQSEYICLLNNDTVVPDNWLEELVKGIESDNRLGAIGSLVLDKGHEEEIENLFFKEKKKFINNIFYLPITEDITKEEEKNKIYYTNGLGGCCLLYRKKIIESPFPEFYFAYAEDNRLSQYILLSGYRLAICGKSLVYHFGSGSFGKKPSGIKLFHGSKNQMINFLTLFGFWSRIKLFLPFLFFRVLQIFYNNPLRRIKFEFIALIRIVKNYHEVSKLRRKVIKSKKISEKQYLNMFSYKILEDKNPYNQKTFNIIARILINLSNAILKIYFFIIR